MDYSCFLDKGKFFALHKIFKYKHLFGTEVSDSLFLFGEVIFLDKFGPHKAGDKIHFLELELNKGIAKTYNEEKKLIFEFNFDVNGINYCSQKI